MDLLNSAHHVTSMRDEALTFLRVPALHTEVVIRAIHIHVVSGYSGLDSEVPTNGIPFICVGDH